MITDEYTKSKILYLVIIFKHLRIFNKLLVFLQVGPVEDPINSFKRNITIKT